MMSRRWPKNKGEIIILKRKYQWDLLNSVFGMNKLRKIFPDELLT
jgi:hypothetical protein